MRRRRRCCGVRGWRIRRTASPRSVPWLRARTHLASRRPAGLALWTGDTSGRRGLGIPAHDTRSSRDVVVARCCRTRSINARRCSWFSLRRRLSLRPIAVGARPIARHGVSWPGCGSPGAWSRRWSRTTVAVAVRRGSWRARAPVTGSAMRPLGGAARIARHCHCSRASGTDVPPAVEGGQGWALRMRDERGISRQPAAVDGVAVDVKIARAKRRTRQDDPSRPAVAGRVRETEDRPIVPADRAPADIIRGGCPRDPRRCPAPLGNPEPPRAREAPSSVVMRRPAPGVATDPGPAVGGKGRPVAVVVRAPVGVNRWIPDVAIVGVVVPGAVAIEGAAVHLQVGRQITRGRRLAGRFVAAAGGPAAEGVHSRGVEALGPVRRALGAHVRALPGSNGDRAAVSSQLCGTSNHRELHRSIALTWCQRDPVLAGSGGDGRSRRCVDLIAGGDGGFGAARDHENHTAFGQAKT
jgi:hypothetical protein